eukprot:scaffold27294_cov59-Phaeocystis_antarctica.AAC.2
MGWGGSTGARGITAVVGGGGGVCGRRLARPHRVPVDHAASEVDVRALYARIHDIHAHALARQIAVVVCVVDHAVYVVDAPRRAHVHAQPAGNGLHLVYVVVARRGGFALGQRHVRAYEAIALDRGDGRVLGHERDGLVRACGSVQVQDVSRVGVGLELAAGGAVRSILGVVLVHPALEIAELVRCVQAAPVGVGRRRLQGHHELVIHGTVDAAAIGDVDWHCWARARADAGGRGRPSANAGDQEGEDHLEMCTSASLRSWGGWVGCETRWCRARGQRVVKERSERRWRRRCMWRIAAQAVARRLSLRVSAAMAAWVGRRG